MSLKEGKPFPSCRVVLQVAQANHEQDAWPSSAAFDLIASALSSDGERKDAIKKGGAIFAFTLKNEQGEQKDWYIDLKETGEVGKGLAPADKKPTGMLLVWCDGWHFVRLD
jgi:hypothetical protein